MEKIGELRLVTEKDKLRKEIVERYFGGNGRSSQIVCVSNDEQHFTFYGTKKISLIRIENNHWNIIVDFDTTKYLEITNELKNFIEKVRNEKSRRILKDLSH